MINWFPLASKLYNRNDFIDLPVAAKIFFVELVSKANSFRGEFYKPDDYFAIKLNVSTKTIRRHRKKLAKMGLINVEPGKLGKNGQKLATSYLKVKHSNAEDCPPVDKHINFAKIHRYSLNNILKYNYEGELNLNDVWIWITLWWWQQNHPTDNFEFFITKKQLEELTGYGQAVKSVKKLYKLPVFGYNDEDRLFEYNEYYHKFNFSSWTFWADPLKSDNTKTFEPMIQRKLDQKRKEEETKDLKEFLEYFKNQYKIIHNKKCNVSSNQKRVVDQLLEKYGLEDLKKIADSYFNSNNLPKTTGTSRKTLARFTALVQEDYLKTPAD